MLPIESENVKCRVVLGKKAEKPVIAHTPILNAMTREIVRITGNEF